MFCLLSPIYISPPMAGLTMHKDFASLALPSPNERYAMLVIYKFRFLVVLSGQRDGDRNNAGYTRLAVKRGESWGIFTE